MTAQTRGASAPDAGVRTSRFHAMAWRWHFYAGLYVVPFLLMLALTGAVMVFFTGFQTRLGPVVTVPVPPGQAPLAVSAQAAAVLELRSQATLREYVAPRRARPRQPVRGGARWRHRSRCGRPVHGPGAGAGGQGQHRLRLGREDPRHAAAR